MVLGQYDAIDWLSRVEAHKQRVDAGKAALYFEPRARRHWASQAGGWLPCETCGGSGEISHEDGPFPCPDCMGTGSLLAGACLRQMFFDYTGSDITNPKSLSDFFKMEIGGLIEKNIVLRDMAAVSAFPLIYKSDPFMPKENGQLYARFSDPRLDREISMELDGMLIFPIPSKQPIEVKSSAGRGATKVKKGLPSYYLMQIQGFYMSKAADDRIFPQFPMHTTGYFRMVGRDYGYQTEKHLVRSDQTFYEAAVDRWVVLERHLRENVMPRAEFKRARMDDMGWVCLDCGKKDYGTWRCKKCSYLNRCRDEGDDEKQINGGQDDE